MDPSRFKVQSDLTNILSIRTGRSFCSIQRVSFRFCYQSKQGPTTFIFRNKIPSLKFCVWSENSRSSGLRVSFRRLNRRPKVCDNEFVMLGCESFLNLLDRMLSATLWQFWSILVQNFATGQSGTLDENQCLQKNEACSAH